MENEYIYEIQNKIHDKTIASMSQRRAIECYHGGSIKPRMKTMKTMLLMYSNVSLP